MKDLLEKCKNGETPEMGRWGSLPLNGQVSCEGTKRGPLFLSSHSLLFFVQQMRMLSCTSVS